MITLRSVDVVFEKRPVLSNVDLVLDEPRIGVIGLNGSGKSTFARLLNGLQTPTNGQILYKNLDVAKNGRKIRRHIGFVFQNPDNQIVYPIVREDLAFGLKNIGLSKSDIKVRIDDIFTQYDLTHLADRFTHQLSGGEKQMVALMGVLIMKPDVIILDEPTTLLDYRNKQKLMSVINGLPQQVIMVTHDLSLLKDFDRVVLFHESEVVGDGKPESVIAKYLSLCDEC
jgi:biotin transport system ATP-binding protein